MIELAGHLDILKDESTPEPIRNYGIELLEQLEAADIDSISTVEDLFGGNYFIIENKEDLKQVAFASTFSGRAPNGDSVNNLFYNCGVFSDTQLLRGDMDYIMFWESTNNAGGPTYFIPDRKSVV